MAKETYADYLLIGGGIACSRAVERIRHIDRRGKIVLVGEESSRPYDRPPLSKGIITGSVQAKEIATATRRYYRRNRAKVLRRRRVEALDLSGEHGIAMLSDGKRIHFARALIATGGRARTLEVPGANLSGVFVLRSLEDAMEIRRAARAGHNSVIVGGGFIGVELAASLASLGITVTLIEARDTLWSPAAPRELRDFLRAFLESLGVRVMTGESITDIHPRNADQTSSGEAEAGESDAGDLEVPPVGSVTTNSAQLIPADFVCIATGIRPNSEIAASADLSTDDGILVDHNLRTSDPRIFAAGDVCRFTDPFSGRSRRVEHHGNAEYGGLLSGYNMGVPSVDSTDAMQAFDYLANLWSDIGDLTVEIGGDEGEWDELVSRGSLPTDTGSLRGDTSWLGLGLQDGRVTCYFAVNAAPAELSAVQVLIRKKVPVSAIREQLSDTSQPLAEVARSVLTS